MSDIIPIDSEITTFSDYLDHNCRCILSARFGDGKSFFLKEFSRRSKYQPFIFGKPKYGYAKRQVKIPAVFGNGYGAQIEQIAMVCIKSHFRV